MEICNEDALDSNFIVDDDEEMDVDDGSESDEEKAVCSFCDDGGELLFCDGRCLRSFHATVDAGEASGCKSLGFSQIQAMVMRTFICPNCQHNQHQCFACGKLGSSDKASGAEVFHCVSATCGNFYHPECVAKLLHPSDDAEAKELEKRISRGDSFTCPAHKCYICKQGENTDVQDLQFAVCRRCPKAYHRKCLPRKISFENLEEDVFTRAWNGLLPNNRVLIYCLKHAIDENLRTPIRNHIIFPNSKEKKRKRQVEELLLKKRPVVERRFLDTQDSCSSYTEFKVPKDVPSSGIKHGKHISEREKLFPAKVKIPDRTQKPLRDSMKYDKSCGVDSRVSSREERLYLSQPSKFKSREVTSRKFEKVATIPPRRNQTAYQVDAETKKSINTMMKEKSNLITTEDVKKGFRFQSELYQHSGKALVDKTITLGKVQGFTEAVRTALQKLEGGGNIEDAKAVCGPEIILRILGWKKKLTVYLSPFLHGNRYSSFGRHFTSVDKLKAVVDKLHWYTTSGDMVVDFCCGANDFSWLMKQKLEETGKTCLFRNFDLIQAKNGFCFEKRDWMTVQLRELPMGSNLIMGLNPPFGVKATLANKFIDKALMFRPKLLILIVPPETERLDRKRFAYDLLWEDSQQFSGKSFYLPGSVDINDEQIQQWNIIPPHLYLWSHPDWTAKHKAIALEHSHISKEQKDLHVNDHSKEIPIYSEDDAQDLQPGPYVSGLNYKAGYSEMSTNTGGTMDGIIRRYSSEGISLATGGNNWSGEGVQHQEYNSQDFNVQVPSYVKDSVGIYGYGQADYTNETDVQPPFPHYGRTNSSSLSSTPYQLIGSAPESTYAKVGSSVRPQYAQDNQNQIELTGSTGLFNNLSSQYPPGSQPNMFNNLTSQYLPGPQPSTFNDLSSQYLPGPQPTGFMNLSSQYPPGSQPSMFNNLSSQYSPEYPPGTEPSRFSNLSSQCSPEYPPGTEPCRFSNLSSQCSPEYPPGTEPITFSNLSSQYSPEYPPGTKPSRFSSLSSQYPPGPRSSTHPHF